MPISTQILRTNHRRLLMIEQYSYYKFETDYDIKKGFFYKIHGLPCLPYDDGKIESSDYFDSQAQARFSAISHIDLLENGEG